MTKYIFDAKSKNNNHHDILMRSLKDILNSNIIKTDDFLSFFDVKEFQINS